MSEGKCPSCGAPVAFTAGTALVLVCGYCQAVVVRKDASLEAHGKVARIVETDSPLQLGIDGRYAGERFTVVGHLQKDHGAGPWDEWYLEFSSGKRAWLSESEGAFHLMFDGGRVALPLSSFAPGKSFTFRDTLFVAEEVGSARVVAAEGQLPDDIGGEALSRYVDATGPKGVFLSLDFSEDPDSPEAFVGRAVPLEELGVQASQLRPRAKKAELAQVRCPKCNGALQLRAPDHTRRVVCPFCGALLDATQGKLAFLQLLELPVEQPAIPLGARGTLQGTEWICIGFQRRYCVVEGEKYPWDEFLLYHRARGFSFLMLSTGHWTHLTPIPAGEVSLRLAGVAEYQGRRYKAFQQVEAITELVLGEFYWEVTQGERAKASEYVCPPLSINIEQTGTEVTYTHGEYLAPAVVQAAFKLKAATSPKGIAPSQPNPAALQRDTQWKWAGAYAVALIALFLVLEISSSKQVVAQETVDLPPGMLATAPEAMRFTAPFEIKRHGNMRVELSAPELRNDWLGVQGDLINEESGEVVSFYSEVSFYSGVEEGESWSEGGHEDTDYLSSIPAGRYVLRLTPAYGAPTAHRFEVRLTSDVPRALWFFLALLALLIAPLFNTLRANSFETSRWNDSNL